MSRTIEPDPPGTVYELWLQPREGGRWTFSEVRGTHRECVDAMDRFPRTDCWFKRIVPDGTDRQADPANTEAS